MSYDDNNEVEEFLALLGFGIVSLLLITFFIIEAAGFGGFLLFLLMLFIIYLAYSDSEKKAKEAEAKEATKKSNLAYERAERQRVAKAKKLKEKQAEETKKWNLYTPQKYFDSLVSSVNRSVKEETLKTAFTNLSDNFNYAYYDKYPLHYLESKANDLGLNVPKRFKKHKILSRNDVKKGEIIKLLIKKKWRMLTKKEPAISISWNSLTIPELKVYLREKSLPLKGKKAELVKRLDKNEEKQTDIVVAGLNDFKFDRKDIVLKKLRHKKRLVRKHAALSIPYDKKAIFEYYLEGSVDRDFFQNALEESLVHFDRDFRKSNSWLFRSNDSSSYNFRESIIEREKDRIYDRLEKLKEIKWEQAIESSVKQDILDIDIGNKIPESKVKIKDKKPSLKTKKTIISFKEWSKDNKGKTFSDYKTEVLGK